MIALLLEDGATSIIVAKRELVAATYTVIHRASVSGARGACLKEQFDLHLVDVGVPETIYGRRGNGISFVQWLIRRRPDAKVVLWSADDYVDMAAKLGVTFVNKANTVTLRQVIAQSPLAT
jgi:DNA-binding NarL/FixJ family response regulator